jgi:hypothetical protein
VPTAISRRVAGFGLRAKQTAAKRLAAAVHAAGFASVKAAAAIPSSQANAR